MRRKSCVLLLVCSIGTSVYADEPVRKSRTAEAIAKEWTFPIDRSKPSGWYYSSSLTPQGTKKLHVFTCATTYGGVYSDVWNFYAARCGTKQRWEPFRISLNGFAPNQEYVSPTGKTKDGEYAILQGGLLPQVPTLFVYRTAEYSVTVTLREGNYKEVVAIVAVTLP